LRFEEWEPIYLEILEDFGFSREEDERAAVILSHLVPTKQILDERSLSRLIGEEVTVIGDAPGLRDQLARIPPKGTVIAADGATSTCMEAGYLPEIIVTDLDGCVKDQIEANLHGSVVIIHAHGDNIDALSEQVPRFEGRIMMTTQSRPFDSVFNWGGFTDGDRATIMAIHFGARTINLMGFDFDNPRHKDGGDISIKKRKLAWARWLTLDLHGAMRGVRPLPIRD